MQVQLLEDWLLLLLQLQEEEGWVAPSARECARPLALASCPWPSLTGS